MRAIAGLAVAGSVPLTAGTILWVIAAVMRRSSPGGWDGTAGAGEVLVLVGLACGLAMIIAAALWQRRMPRIRPVSGAEPLSYAEQPLVQLTRPEQHAYPAGRPPTPAYPPPDASMPAYPHPEGQAPGYPQPPPPGLGRP
jgi:hypothetical protein